MTEQRYGTGYIPDRHDSRDMPLGASREAELVTGELPTRWSHAKHIDKPRNQLATESCTGFSSARAVHVCAGAAGISIEHPSELVPYSHARAIEAHDPSAPLRDEGAMLRDIFKGMARYGLVSERHWPFDPARVNERVPPDVLRDGADALLEGYYRIESNAVDAMKRALVSGYPIVFGMLIDAAYNDYNGGLYVPGGAERGAHAQCVVGFDEEAFEVANSWGADWGINGVARIPFAVMMSNRAWDKWAVKVAPVLAP